MQAYSWTFSPEAGRPVFPMHLQHWSPTPNLSHTRSHYFPRAICPLPSTGLTPTSYRPQPQSIFAAFWFPPWICYLLAAFPSF
jgi:hypothetical protein